MNNNRDSRSHGDAWYRRFNYNTVTSVCMLFLWTVMFFTIPYQIQKPTLFMGRTLMD